MPPWPATTAIDDRSVTASGALDANLEKVVDIETVRPLLEALPERELTVLRLRFFENMTQTQIAERLGISQMHVSRLLARSLTKAAGSSTNGQNGFEREAALTAPDRTPAPVSLGRSARGSIFDA